MRIETVFFTNRGKREKNEDSILRDSLIFKDDMEKCEMQIISGDEFVFAVADGMGGHGYGEAASRIVLEVLKECKGMLTDPEKAYDYIYKAADMLKSAAETNPEYGNYGSAVSVLRISETGESFIINCGDCRIYRLNGKYLEKITKDHSIVQGLFDAGIISEDEMRKHPQKNIVTSALMPSSDRTTEIQRKKINIKKGNVFFICSDGVWEVASLEQMEECFFEKGITDIGEKMVNKIIDSSSDNISFIIMKIMEE